MKTKLKINKHQNTFITYSIVFGNYSVNFHTKFQKIQVNLFQNHNMYVSQFNYRNIQKHYKELKTAFNKIDSLKSKL